MQTLNSQLKLGRRVGIYSEDGQEFMTLTAYSVNGIKRIVLNDLDLPLTDFHDYLKCLETNYLMNEFLYVGMNASFLTGAVMLFIIFATVYTHEKIDCLA